jgi:hypothetical protein
MARSSVGGILTFPCILLMPSILCLIFGEGKCHATAP